MKHASTKTLIVGCTLLLMCLCVFTSLPLSVHAADNQTILVGSGPDSIAITPDGQYAYVTNNAGNSVSVINLASNRVTATITGLSAPPVEVKGGGPIPGTTMMTSGAMPDYVAITPDGQYAYVANSGNASVSAISTATNKVVVNIPVGYEPFCIAITPNGKYAYVSDYSNYSVSVIDTATNQVTTNITLSGGPKGVALTPNGEYAYVSEYTFNYKTMATACYVAVIDTATNTVKTKIPVDGYPGYIAITPNGKSVYVVSLDNSDDMAANGFVSVINTADNQVTSKISVGSRPNGIAITPNGEYAYVTNVGTDEYVNYPTPVNSSISVVSLTSNKVIATLQVPVGDTPYAMAVTPNGQYAYLTNGGPGSVTAIDTASTIPTNASQSSTTPFQSPLTLVVAVVVLVIVVAGVVVLVRKRKANSTQTSVQNPVSVGTYLFVFITGGKLIGNRR